MLKTIKAIIFPTLFFVGTALAGHANCPKDLAQLCVSGEFITFENSDVRCKSIEKDEAALGFTKQAGERLQKFTKNKIGKVMVVTLYDKNLIFSIPDETKLDIADDHPNVLAIATLRSGLNEMIRIPNLSKDNIKNLSKVFSAKSCSSVEG